MLYGALAGQTWGMIAWKWITAKVQYCIFIIRTWDGEVEWLEWFGGNLGVW